ncbi:MAG: type II toxin-antitoxin system RelB/DinJ family antitoxin [Coriobacteriia bacterium]|nr:type II toxin-antitoxin system RelB/DinJ family antitoxin [Coriobacteriia bacterium]
MVTARVPIEIKKRASIAFESLGVTPTQAINALYEYVVKFNSLPDFRSEEQILYEGRERVLDPQTMTPKIQRMIAAMKAIENQEPIDWGEDAGKSSIELLKEAKDERAKSLLGYKYLI